MEINHNPSYLFLSREDEDDVRDIENTTFVQLNFTLCYLMVIGKVGSLFSLADERSGYQNKFICKVHPSAEIGKVPVYFSEVRGNELKNVSLMFYKMELRWIKLMYS